MNNSLSINNILQLKETVSTNQHLQELIKTQLIPEGFVVSTGFQTAGKGQSGNSWESERNKNLLFSLVLYPSHIPIEEQFLISQLVSVAMKKVLEKRLPDVSVKWPNDVYTGDRKVAGILIENTWIGSKIGFSVIGIGLNVNQSAFTSDAPNPVSVLQITGKETDKDALLTDILKQIQKEYTTLNAQRIRREYHKALYRGTGLFPFRSDKDEFLAEIVAVHPDGQLELRTEKGEIRKFYFKEVQFILPDTQKC